MYSAAGEGWRRLPGAGCAAAPQLHPGMGLPLAHAEAVEVWSAEAVPSSLGWSTEGVIDTNISRSHRPASLETSSFISLIPENHNMEFCPGS